MTSAVNSNGFSQINKTTWSTVQEIEDEDVELRFNMSMIDQADDQREILTAIKEKISSQTHLWQHTLKKGLTVSVSKGNLTSKSYRIRETREKPSLLTRIFRAIFYWSKTDKKIMEIDVTRSATQSIHIDPNEFYRIDERTWSLFRDIEGERREIRFNIPKTKEEKDKVALLKTLEQTFTTAYSTELSQKRLQTGFNFKIDRKHCKKTTYRIQQQKELSYPTKLFHKTVNRIWPYAYSEMPNKKIITLNVTQPGIFKRILNTIFCVKNSVYTFKKKELESPTLRFTGSDSFQSSFTDPFTKLSTWCFQTIESDTNFIMHKQHRGAYRLVLSDVGLLQLEKIGTTTQTPQQNRHTVQVYKSFLEKEYGEEIVEQILTLCGIDLDAMIQGSRPLLPDHVFKCNIAACNIEMPHVEALWKKLQSANEIVKDQKGNSEAWKDIMANEISSLDKLCELFSIRELRGLERVIQDKYCNCSLALLARFLTDYVDGRNVESIRDLPEEVSSEIISMLMPTDEDLDNAFTGRKMRHLEITGSRLMENKDNANPCRLIFELLHTYKDLAKTNDWLNFYELLSHTVVKKALYRPPHGNAQERLRVGVILPAPSSKYGARWYYNEAFLDDSQGRISYDFLPVAKDAKDKDGNLLPFIRAFRSTSSNKHSINYLDSIAADLAPTRSPGSLKPGLGYKHQGNALEERTIPLWVAQLMAPRSTDPDLAGKELKEIAKLCIEYVRQKSSNNKNVVSALENAIKDNDNPKLNQLLLNWATSFKESTKDKTRQKIVFLGQSLGAGLAQFETYYLTAHKKRVPLPNQQCECYTYNGPAIDHDDDKAFMEIGQKNAAIFKQHNISFKIRHQFEYRDIVPIAGGSHLGITGYKQEDSSWLNFSAAIFRPLPTAEALSITTPRPHRRKICRATAGVDYSISRITPAELVEHDRGWWMSSKVANLFGHTITRSPKLSEITRRTVGVFAYIPLKIIGIVRGAGIGRRGSDGVLSLTYPT